MWTRHGANFTDRLPRIAEAVRSLPGESAPVDGEAVAFRPDGQSDFGALRAKAGGSQACLVAFDLLALDGEDLRHRPLEERRKRLARLIAAGADGVVFGEALATEGALVFAKACALGLEGIVSKRVSSLYWRGNSRQWLKTEPRVREGVIHASRRRAQPVRRARPGAVDRLRAMRTSRNL